MTKNKIRSFSIIASITIIALVIDTSISNVSDIINIKPLVSSFSYFNSLYQWNFLTIIVITYGIGQYFILRFIKQIQNDDDKRNKNRPKYLELFDKIITLIQYYAITPLIVVIVFQMLVSSQYTTGLVMTVLTISYLLSITVFMMLSIQFVSWFYSSFKITDKESTGTKNIMLLLYGLASAATSAALVSTLIFYDIILLGKPPTIGINSEVVFPQFYPNSTMGFINSFYSILNVISFLLLWVSSAKLLRHFSKGLGNLRFWTVVGIPLAFFISQFIILMPSMPQDDGENHILTIILYSLQGLIGGILFGIPFLDLSRRIKKVYSGIGSIKITEYMIATAFGFMLTYVSGYCNSYTHPLSIVWAGQCVFFGFVFLSGFCGPL